jgi:hypothetical protein
LKPNSRTLANISAFKWSREIPVFDGAQKEEDGESKSLNVVPRPSVKSERWRNTMCDHVTPLIRAACTDVCIGSGLISGVIEKICDRLKDDPQTAFSFNLFCGEAAGPTEWASVRVQFFREDWSYLLDNLPISNSGDWSEDTLRYEGHFFELTANAADNEVVVTFW